MESNNEHKRTLGSSKKTVDDSTLQKDEPLSPKESLESNNMGSGLALFFRDFYSCEADVNTESIGFSTGLSQLPPQKNNSNFIDEVRGVKYTEGGILYSQWRESEKKYLLKYLNRRLHPRSTTTTALGASPETKEESSLEATDEKSEESEDEENEPVMGREMAMETQERLLEPLEANIHRKEKVRRKDRIPCIQDCLHNLTKLKYLDLHARTLTLPLSRIYAYWRLRSVKRCGILDKQSISKPAFHICSGKQKELQRVVYEEKEDDGPVSVIFKKVIHFEVEELSIESASGADLLSSSRIPGRQEGENKRKRIKVFFYNNYATAVFDWLQEQKRKQQQLQQSPPTKKKQKLPGNTVCEISTTTAVTDFVMSLSNIPAISIFPYEIDPRNWREKEELMDYCLCIGGKSVANDRASHQGGAKKREENSGIRFDSDEMEIRLMPVIRKTTLSRTISASGNTVTKDETFDVDPSSELILSRQKIATETSSGSEEDVIPRRVVDYDPLPISAPNILQRSWSIYTKQQSRVTATDTNSTQGSGPRSAVGNGAESEPVANDEIKQVEPMIFRGVAERRFDSTATHYVRLGEIPKMIGKNTDGRQSCNLKVNIYASIAAVTPPRMTRRGDWMISATLIDESYYETPLTINIFCKSLNLLPDLVWMGDVIRIHRAVLQTWNGRIQLQGLKPTQYVVIRRMGSDWTVLPTAPNYFSFTPMDEMRSQTLWRWAAQHRIESSIIKHPSHCFTISELQNLRNGDDENVFQDRDITVMVLEKMRYESSDVHPHGLLRVWDGTGNPPSDPLFLQSKLLPPAPGEPRGPTSSQKAIENVILASQNLQACFSDMGVPDALYGRVANVVIWEKSHWDLIEKHIPVGTFLRLRNVHIPQRWEDNDFRSIFMHDKSWMTGLPKDNHEVRSLLRKHFDRVRNGGRSNRNDNYNREFRVGCLPHNLRWVGSGLMAFSKQNQSNAQVFTGAVHIIGYFGNPDALKVVTIADRSGTIRALVLDTLRQKLWKSLCESVKSTTRNSPPVKRFLARIRMFAVDDEDGGQRKHFVLTNAVTMD